MNVAGKLLIAVAFAVVLTALAFIPAQFMVWGLSLFHVNSGIWGSWLLLSAAESVVTAGVALGVRRAS